MALLLLALLLHSYRLYHPAHDVLESDTTRSQSVASARTRYPGTVYRWLQLLPRQLPRFAETARDDGRTHRVVYLNRLLHQRGRGVGRFIIFQ